LNQSTQNTAISDIQAVIFDMDGLLFDTEALYVKVWVVVGEKLGLPITEEVARANAGHTGQALVNHFQSHYGPGFTLEAARPIIYEWMTDRVAEHGLPVKPGARELVESLHRLGIPMAVGSSNRADVVRAYLEEAGMLAYFPVMVAGDMVERVKPAPDIFLRAARNLGVAPEHCLVFEDSPVGVEAAHAAGCVVVMVPDLHQPCEVTRGRCWKVIDSLKKAMIFFDA